MNSLRQLRTWALVGLLAAATLRCSGDTVTPRTPTAIEKVSGDGQTGVVEQSLANLLVVRVTDASGDPVEGTSVQWDAQGNGTVSANSVSTDAEGLASVTRVLGATTGAVTTTATATGLAGSPVTFTSTAVTGPSGVSLLLITSPPVSALTGEVFDPAVQPVVEVQDGQGAPVAGSQVTASIVSGGGLLEGTTTATSDAQGVARFGDLGIRGTGPQTLQFSIDANSVTASPVEVSALAPEATTGKWGPLVPWDIVPLHIHLLPTGKLLAWGKFEAGTSMMANPRLWDPAAGPPTTAREVPADTMLFCAGHTFMADGRLMVSGGHKQDAKGIDVTNIFDPSSESWTPALPKMAHGRWYPTVTTLPDGRLLTMAGRDSAGNVVTTPEIWEANRWVELPGAGTLEIPYYPRNFVAPDGRIFMAGERIQSRWFDGDGSTAGGRGSWSNGPTHLYNKNRDYGTAVMYEPGKILIAGGGGDLTWGTPDPKAAAPTATAEKIDLSVSSPSWASAGSMSAPRRHLNSTILPDGTVLITGGTRGGGFVDIDPANAVREAELWDPATNQWTSLAANSVMRVYHSVSILLPDGTVLHGGSGDAFTAGGTVPVPPERNHEIFSPPYLFKGARPRITTAPAAVGYNGTFTVATPNAAQITGVRWIRLGSVTHAFDMGQRANTLAFTSTATGVEVTAPGNPNLAPPGHYQLFLLNRNGVPSEGKIIQVQ